MKLLLMKDNAGNQQLIIRINERPTGEAYIDFHDRDSAEEGARKLKTIADDIIEAAKNG